MAEMKNQNDQNQPQNVPVRGEQPNQLQRRERNPYQLMREFLRDPFGAMVASSEFAPQMEVRETKDAFIFKADLPGVRKEDIDIDIHGSRLQISGKRDDEHEERDGERVYAYERSYGTFMRAFTLPETADTEHIRSDFDNGVLSVVVPKKAGAQPRKIQIGGGSKS
jgi:HSP20 family protein